MKWRSKSRPRPRRSTRTSRSPASISTGCLPCVQRKRSQIRAKRRTERFGAHRRRPRDARHRSVGARDGAWSGRRGAEKARLRRFGRLHGLPIRQGRAYQVGRRVPQPSVKSLERLAGIAMCDQDDAWGESRHFSERNMAELYTKSPRPLQAAEGAPRSGSGQEDDHGEPRPCRPSGRGLG